MIQPTSGRKEGRKETRIFCVDSGYLASEQPEKNIELKTDIAQLEDGSFDCIFMMDVLEHVADDKAFFKAALSKLKKGGVLIITVPAFQSLFSSHDVFVKHFRRYDTSMLAKVLAGEDVSLLRMHYFYFCLFFARLAQKKLGLTSLENEKETGVNGWHFGEKHFVTKLVRAVLNADFALLSLLVKIKLRLPGLSLLAVVQKG